MTKPNLSSCRSKDTATSHTSKTFKSNVLSSRHRVRKWGWRALTLVFSCVLAGLVGEAILRVVMVQEGKRWASYDRVLGWRGTPHARGVYVRQSDNIRIAFRYNELGFRDREVVPKPSGNQRLMLLGDSFVESLEVELEQTFGALLEESLGRRESAWDVCVIGSQGYSTAQELLAFRKFQPVVQADLVLLCFFCGNDFADNLRQRFAYLDEQQQLVLPQPRESDWVHRARYSQRWLYESSHVVYLLKNSFQSLANISLVPASKAVVEQNEAYQRDITHLLLNRLQAEVTQAGGQLGVVVIPDRDDLVSGDRQKADWVINSCQTSLIPYLDLSQVLTKDDFFDVDLHFNPRGHRLVAQSIEAFVAAGLKSSGSMDQGPTVPAPLFSDN